MFLKWCQKINFAKCYCHFIKSRGDKFQRFTYHSHISKGPSDLKEKWNTRKKQEKKHLQTISHGLFALFLILKTLNITFSLAVEDFQPIIQCKLELALATKPKHNHLHGYERVCHKMGSFLVLYFVWGRLCLLNNVIWNWHQNALEKKCCRILSFVQNLILLETSFAWDYLYLFLMLL